MQRFVDGKLIRSLLVYRTCFISKCWLLDQLRAMEHWQSLSKLCSLEEGLHTRATQVVIVYFGFVVLLFLFFFFSFWSVWFSLIML